MNSLCIMYMGVILEEERVNKDQNRDHSGDRVFQFEPRRLATKGNLFALLGWMRDRRLGVPRQQVLAIGDRWRIDGVGDRGPQGGADEEECERGPESVGDQADNDALEAGL